MTKPQESEVQTTGSPQNGLRKIQTRNFGATFRNIISSFPPFLHKLRSAEGWRYIKLIASEEPSELKPELLEPLHAQTEVQPR